MRLHFLHPSFPLAKTSMKLTISILYGKILEAGFSREILSFKKIYANTIRSLIH